MDQLWNKWIESQNDPDINIIPSETEATESTVHFEIDDVSYQLERTGSFDEEPAIRLSTTVERPQVVAFVNKVNE